MNIAIIGAGNIGGTLGRLWVRAGHGVMFGVRNPQAIEGLVAELGPTASATSAADAAARGEALVFAGPFGAWPEFAKANTGVLAGKVVIDAANPYPARDGAIAEAVVKGGLDQVTMSPVCCPLRVVKAFNTIYWVDLRDKAHVADPRLAMPIAGDDPAAVQLASDLAVDAGFDPVVVGGLAKAIDLDPGSPIYAKSFTAAEVRAALTL